MKNKTRRKSYISEEDMILLKESVKCIMDSDYPIKIITKKQQNGRTNNKRKSM